MNHYVCLFFTPVAAVAMDDEQAVGVIDSWLWCVIWVLKNETRWMKLSLQKLVGWGYYMVKIA